MEIRLSREAEQQLEQIQQYYYGLGSPRAIQFVDELVLKLYQLLKFPHIGVNIKGTDDKEFR